MISEPYEDITKACEDAEANAAKYQMDHAVIMTLEVDTKDNEYRIVPVVQLDDIETWYRQEVRSTTGWALMAIAKPSGLVYTWQPVPGYDEEGQR